MSAFVLGLLAASVSLASAGARCPTCVTQDPAVEKLFSTWEKLSEKELLEQVRSSGVCVQVLDSERKNSGRFFQWGTIVTPTGLLSSVTSKKNLMGKTFCADEHEVSKGCATIVLASDAPRSTLLHEYLHTRQIAKDPSWCPLSRELWKRQPTEAESRILSDREWDVLRFLWLNRDSLGFNVEDQLTVTSELLEQGMSRKSFDAEAVTFVMQEKVTERLSQLMKEYQTAMVSASPSAKGSSREPAEWAHKKVGPLVLTDAIVSSVYSDEKKPSRHNGLTETNYLQDFVVSVKEAQSGCFRPEIRRWIVQSTLYVRAEKTEGPQGSAVSNPRWMDLSRYACREIDRDFNTWEGTLFHEEQHFDARDTLLKSFWKELKDALSSHCSPSQKQAEEYLSSIVQMFLTEVKKADTEDRAEGLEAKWYREHYEAKTRKSCAGAFPHLKAMLPGTQVKQEGTTIRVEGQGDSWVGLEKNGTTVLASRKTGAKLYFQFGSILAKEEGQGVEKTRLEYRVDGRLKHQVWLGLKGEVLAKAWADDSGKLGKRVSLISSNPSSADTSVISPLVSVLDTGHEATDEDGHGTFVVSVVKKAAGSQKAPIESIRVSTNLDETLWNALAQAKGRVINLSIGQGVNSSKPPTQAAIDRTCSEIRKIAREKLVVMGAGNDGAQLERAPFFPAACPNMDGANVLVVGSFDRLTHAGADFGRTTSNTSSRFVDILVSGALYDGHYPGGVAARLGGTSFSAAHVSGLAARYWSEKPTATVAEVRASLLSRCVKAENSDRYSRNGCVLVR